MKAARTSEGSSMRSTSQCQGHGRTLLTFWLVSRSCMKNKNSVKPCDTGKWYVWQPSALVKTPVVKTCNGSWKFRFSPWQFNSISFIPIWPLSLLPRKMGSCVRKLLRYLFGLSKTTRSFSGAVKRMRIDVAQVLWNLFRGTLYFRELIVFG